MALSVVHLLGAKDRDRSRPRLDLGATRESGQAGMVGKIVQGGPNELAAGDMVGRPRRGAPRDPSRALSP
jgi:hypothetical protein